jgi:hypothetical protein
LWLGLAVGVWAATPVASGGFTRRDGHAESLRNAGAAPEVEPRTNPWDAERWQLVAPVWWERWYGTPDRPATGPHVRDDLSGLTCRQRPVPGGGPSLRQCGAIWLEPVYVGESVRFYEVAPPAGLEQRELDGARPVEVGSQAYLVEGHTFFLREERDGRPLFVSVETPVGAVVDAPPTHVRAASGPDGPLLQYDSIFYRAEGTGADRRYVVVPPPPAP